MNCFVSRKQSIDQFFAEYRKNAGNGFDESSEEEGNAADDAKGAKEEDKYVSAIMKVKIREKGN